jgi:hypothetical protein
MESVVSEIKVYLLIVTSKSALENSESFFSRSWVCVKYWWRTSTIKGEVTVPVI